MPTDEIREIEAGAAPAHPPPDAPDADRETVIRGVNAALRAGLSQNRIGKESGLSGPRISSWLKGKYAGDNAATQAKLSAWLQTRATMAALPVAPGVRSWVNTPTAREIERAFFLARSLPSIAVVFGAAGVGKTTAVKHHARTAPNVWAIEASEASSSMAAVLKQIAGVLGLSGSYRNYDLFNDIVHRLKGTCGLLVVDEAQKLTFAALEQVRAIHDAAEIGVVFVGGEGLYAHISGGNRRLDHAQLWSRCAPVVRIPGTKEADVIAILESCGIEGKAARDYACQIAVSNGLRSLVKTLEQAALFSGDGGSPDLGAIKAAYVETGGES